ncbi:hypothetical protein SSX86_017450 [Deinandra increscens subsp. villosa]|uniref:Ribosomal protein L34Ae n=1 Tax=Deinandra increscens subsp. villosa TaxID=3103831 RepID=A0AAP0D2G0_9ASTR
MATHMFHALKSHFNLIFDPFPADLLQRTMIKVCTFIWLFLLTSFRHLIKHLAGSRIGGDHEKNLGPPAVLNEQERRIVPSSNGSDCSITSIFDGFGEKSDFTFGFQFQMKEEDLFTYKGRISGVELEKTGDVIMENGPITKTSTSKYQFVSVQDFGGFVAEPESGSFTVHESPPMEDIFVIKEKGIGQSQSLDQIQVQQQDEVKDDSFYVPLDEKVNDFTEKEKEVSVTDGSSCDEVQESQEISDHQVNNWLGDFIMKNDNFCYGFNLSHESELDYLEDHPESDDSGDGFYSICPQDVNSVIDHPDSKLETLIQSFPEEIDDDDCIELEPNREKEPQNFDSNAERGSDSCLENELESENGPIRSWEFDSDGEDEDDVLLEHQELIGQMKMELKNARTGGLPTILEECETPRVKEDYKPLQINEKLEHRDQMAEIQKFYKSYAEKMRKLDVLNYQTLQAINFLRMKHPDQTNTGENTSLSAIKSVLLPSLWPCKLRRIYADPTLKSITELHKDLEIVYVGQACLSWEILHWQYKKAKELQLYDPQGYRSYNQIAIEFQQFHVLLRRFTEDELFQGPRVQNFTKQRCTLRGLLQVPAIRDDNLKEKNARKKEEGDAVSISSMAKMIKESMMVFWEFLHTDKDTTNLFLTIILQGSKAHLQDPADSDLFMDIKTIHQKKERRLKDMLRTGNCIVKKFQKQQETVLDQHMFVSQVELRLVSRVLSLPRLSRDQLVWCQSKLNNIKFIDRKIQVEDSLFLLFPC